MPTYAKVGKKVFQVGNKHGFSKPNGYVLVCTVVSVLGMMGSTFSYHLREATRTTSLQRGTVIN